MLLNLLSNAVKFSNEGIIRVEALIVCKNTRYFLETTVKDQGIGLTKEEAKNIFTPFYFLANPRR